MECKMKEDKLSQRGIFETPLQSLSLEKIDCFCFSIESSYFYKT